MVYGNVKIQMVMFAVGIAIRAQSEISLKNIIMLRRCFEM
jgi:hypothetical protein